MSTQEHALGHGEQTVAEVLGGCPDDGDTGRAVHGAAVEGPAGHIVVRRAEASARVPAHG